MSADNPKPEQTDAELAESIKELDPNPHSDAAVMILLPAALLHIEVCSGMIGLRLSELAAATIANGVADVFLARSKQSEEAQASAEIDALVKAGGKLN